LAESAFNQSGHSWCPVAPSSAEEAEELARKSTDFGAQQAYEKIGQLWREMAQRAERNKR
jgi:hypothetical protein